MSEEPKVESVENKGIEFSEGVLSYMLSLVDPDILIKLLLKTFKPGTEVFEDFIANYTHDSKFRKLFVFDLPADVTEAMLRDVCSSFGEIEDVRLVVDSSTNKSRGYGFIVFVDALSALKAINTETVVGGRPLQLKYAIAKDNPPKPKGVAVTPVSDQGPKDSRKLHVNGFPITWTNDDINKFFSDYGTVEEAFICYEKGTHNSRGFGFVTFALKADYDKCLENPVKNGEGFEIRCSPISLSKGDDRSRRYRNERRYDDHRSHHDDRYDDRRRDRSRDSSRERSRDRPREDYSRANDRYYPPYEGYSYPPPPPMQRNDYPPNSYPPYQGSYENYPYPPQNYNYPPQSTSSGNNSSEPVYDNHYYPPSGY